VVREEGFEPPRACARQVLSLLRLPVPPFPQIVANLSIAQPSAAFIQRLGIIDDRAARSFAEVMGVAFLGQREC
jgi:hypothetical protein